MGDSNMDAASARSAVDGVGTPPFIMHALRGAPAGCVSAMLTRSRVVALVVPLGCAFFVLAIGELGRPAVAAITVLAVVLLSWLTSSIFRELKARDVLERKVALQRADLHQSVYRDPVTGLGNRTLLRERAGTDRVRVGTTAVLLLDLDGFKEINDTLGHTCGDAVLMQVGVRLGGLTRTQDTVVRLGGDEFVLLLPETGQSAAMSIAERALVSLREPMTVDNTRVRVRASLGMALGSSSVDVDELVRQADLAMYEAKAEGGDLARIFATAMHDRLRDRLQIEGEVREALATNQFAVYYQPIIDTRSGDVTGLEALVRWDHPLRGVLPPYEFLPAAERTGLIRELGMFVLRTACEQLSEWRRDWPELTVAVNLSHRELLDPELGAKVAGVLGETGFPPHALHLEITETVVSADDHIAHVIASLAACRVSFSIDDFGTGHSSLSRLRSLPVQRLKIDRSFIGEIVGGRAPLLSSIIALAHSMGRTVVAEGVETPEQFDFLVGRGCDEVQGYLFSRPVPADHVIPLLFSTRMAREDIDQGSPTVLPELISTLSDDRLLLDPAIRALLRELSSLSGLETTFVTTVREGQQVTRFAHNAGAMTIPEGLSVGWSDTLCRRLIEDDMQHSTDVGSRYGDLDAVNALGIETYVTIPIRESGGELIGTLCGASAQPKDVDDSVLSLMRLFALVLAERIPALGRRVDPAPPTIPSSAAH